MGYLISCDFNLGHPVHKGEDLLGPVCVTSFPYNYFFLLNTILKKEFHHCLVAKDDQSYEDDGVLGSIRQGDPLVKV